MSQNRLREQAVLIRLFLREQNHISRPPIYNIRVKRVKSGRAAPSGSVNVRVPRLDKKTRSCSYER